MSIIKDLKFLSANYIPEKLPARENLVNEIKENLLRKRCRVLLAGITGTGKTISVQKVVKLVGKDFILIEINCSENSSFTTIAQKIIQEIRKKPYKVAGKTRSELSDYMGKLLRIKRSKHIVFIFDEVDKILNKKDNHQEIFFPLLNHGDSSFILISNDTNILEKLDPRINSRLSMDVKNVEAYNPNETYHILKQRAKLSLINGSYDTNSLIEIAINSSAIGDIRFALRCLEQATLICDRFNKTKIDKEVIQAVMKNLENIEFDKKFNALPIQLKISLAAVAKESEKEGFAITYPNSYNRYLIFIKNLKIMPIGNRRFRDFLNKLKMLGFIFLQDKSLSKRGGRVRIATPNFDYKKFLRERYYN
jgi:Cdc6-like AAA superfamily ATPase